MTDNINWLTEDEKETQILLRQAERQIKGLCVRCGANPQVWLEMMGEECGCK